MTTSMSHQRPYGKHVAEDIGEVYFSEAMNAKINNAQHRLTSDDVLHACWTGSLEEWIYDDERG